MRLASVLPFLLVAACTKQAPVTVGASAEETVQRFTAAVEASDFDAAARLMAPGYKERWLVHSLAVLPAFGVAMPKVKEAFDRIREKHGLTLDGLQFREPLEEPLLEAIRQRIAAVDDPDALLADVLRVNMQIIALATTETGYPEDRGREPDWKAVLAGTRTVEVDGRWFVVLDLPTASVSVGEPH